MSTTTTTDSNATNLSEQQLQNLVDTVVDDYLDLENADPEGEPDLTKDQRFKRFVLTCADGNALQAALAYFQEKEATEDPIIRQFVVEYGTDATFADLKRFLDSQNQKQ